MSRSLSEESINESRLKTIVSEEATRNQTTQKKVPGSPEEFRRSNPHFPQSGKIHKKFKSKRCQSLRQILHSLEYSKSNLMKNGNYSRAIKIDSDIARTKSLLNKIEIKKINKNQQMEKRLIKQAYESEMKYFEQVWENYFEQYRQKQTARLNNFKMNKQVQIKDIRYKLKKRCTTLRNKSKEIIQLQKQQSYYLRKGDARQLSAIKREKDKAKNKIYLERSSMISKWTQMEQEQISRYQSKKYSILLKKLQEQRIDQEKTYLFEKKRLQQKYKNVLSQLKHQQRMTIHFIKKWFEPKLS